MAHQYRFAGKKAAWASLLAASSLALTPAQAQAAEMAPVNTAGYATGFIAQATASTTGATALDAPRPKTQGADNVQEYGRYGWRGGWRGYRRHRRGVRAGDVIAGVAILGGIAAIASAANKREREREVVVVERDRDYRYRPENRRNSLRSTTTGSGIDNAVSMCLNEIEQDIRVDSVDGASRVGTGWIVTGSLFDGSGFSCQIDNSGRISGVDYGRAGGISSLSSAQDFARAEGQFSDDRYASARADVGGSTRPDLAIDPADMGGTRGPNIAINTDDERLPAYPGGPLPGEEFRD